MPPSRLQPRNPRALVQPALGAPLTAALALFAVTTVAGAALTSSAASGAPRPRPALTPTQASYHNGSPVDVLYAGSLVNVMEDHIGPAFHRATGDGFEGLADGSQALATDIKAKLVPADVFISASPAVDKALEGKANGDRLSAYRVFAHSSLVIGYNPQSKFAAQLKAKPWYDVVSEPGFKLGRTDPATDPKGVLAVDALDGAASRYKLPALRALATETDDVYPEQSLVGRLKLGDLDAGFFYAVEATAAKFPTVALSGFSNLQATYTIATVNGAPHPAGARAFVSWFTGPAGEKILNHEGLTTLQ